MNRVKEFRQKLGLSQEELSRATGIPRTSISAIEQSRAIPSVDYAIRLAKVLGSSVEELFTQERLFLFPGFEEGLFVSYLIGDRRMLFPLSLIEGRHTPDGYYSKGRIEWFRPHTLPTYSFAGCDPSFRLLSEALLEEGIRLVSLNLSSSKALEALRSGLVHMAGVHMGSFEDNLRYAKEFLGRGYRALRLFSWEEGIGLRERAHLNDLRNKLWLVRERGSGARKVFDELSRDLEIGNYREISGGHEGVAYGLKEGFGDAGVMIRAHAAEYSLDFISIRWEDYCIFYAEQMESDRNFLRLLDYLRGKRHTRVVSCLPGYEKKNPEEVEL